MSDFIPNSFQTPNTYVDRFMAFLTPEEFKVLVYMVRRILGFHKHQDQISLNQFSTGIEDQRGQRLDWGTGLSKPAIMRALDSLIDFGLVIELAPGNARTHDGAVFALQLDSDKVNLAALRKRVEERRERDRERTEKARANNPKRKGYSVGQNSTEDDGDPGDGEAESVSYSVGQNSTEDDRSVQSDRTALFSPTNGIYSVGLNDMNLVGNTVENQDHAPAPKGAARGRASPDQNKQERSAEEKREINERHMAILAGYLSGLGYPWDGSREARAAKKLAELGYTSDRVQRFYVAQKATMYWFDRHLSLEIVAKDIGAWEQSRQASAGGPQNGNGTSGRAGTNGRANGHAPVSHNGMAGGAMPADFAARERERLKRQRQAAAAKPDPGREE
jgi:hypothetical protein